MKNSADLGGCYPPRPSASVDNTLFYLQNSSNPTQPHSVIANSLLLNPTETLATQARASLKKRTVIGKHFYKSLQYNQWSAKRNSKCHINPVVKQQNQSKHFSMISFLIK